MGGKTITREDICNELSKKMGIDRYDSKKILEQIIKLMIEGIVSDNLLKIHSFGSFYAISKKERKGRNFVTKEDAVISPRRSIIFRFSGRVKKKIISPNKKLIPIKIKINFTKDIKK